MLRKIYFLEPTDDPRVGDNTYRQGTQTKILVRFTVSCSHFPDTDRNPMQISGLRESGEGQLTVVQVALYSSCLQPTVVKLLAPLQVPQQRAPEALELQPIFEKLQVLCTTLRSMIQSWHGGPLRIFSSNLLILRITIPGFKEVKQFAQI